MSEAVQAEIKKYSEQLAADPKSRSFVPLSDAYRRLGQYDEAIAVAREGVGHHPHYLSGKMALARALFENGELDESQSLLEAVLHVSPDNVLANRILSSLYLQKGLPERAAPVLKQLLKLDPNDTRAVQQLEAIGKTTPSPPASEAHIPVEAAVAVGPGPGAAAPASELKTATLAELYRKQGHIDQALEIYRDVSHGDPGNPEWKNKIEELEQNLSARSSAGGDIRRDRISTLRDLLKRIQERKRRAA